LISLAVAMMPAAFFLADLSGPGHIGGIHFSEQVDGIETACHQLGGRRPP
jgi:hypothetical protein